MTSKEHARSKTFSTVLQRIVDLSIKYAATDSVITEGCYDASFDTNSDDSKSTAALLIMIENGTILNNQTCVAFSMMEAEYMVMTQATKVLLERPWQLAKISITQRTDSKSAESLITKSAIFQLQEVLNDWKSYNTNNLHH